MKICMGNITYTPTYRQYGVLDRDFTINVDVEAAPDMIWDTVPHRGDYKGVHGPGETPLRPYTRYIKRKVSH